ncbi:MAG: pyrroline-5-carboxylate reductase family protein, partial [Flavisolibacter sp.]
MDKLTIIGGGNLGSAIAEGLLNSGFIKPEQLIITKRNYASLKRFNESGVDVTCDNKEAVSKSKYIIIAVKPYHIEELLLGLKDSLKPGQLIISVVTGVWIKDIQGWVGKERIVFRAMPNTAIAIQESMTCIAYQNAKEEEIKFVEQLFENL